jgi:hypothetical protein
MFFEYGGCFYFSEEDEQIVLDSIKNGRTPKQAVDEWSWGLDDNDRHCLNEVKDQIISYIHTKI